MFRRTFLGCSIALALPACSGAQRTRPAPAGSDGITALRAEYESLMREHGLHEWSRYAGVAAAEGDASFRGKRGIGGNSGVVLRRLEMVYPERH